MISFCRYYRATGERSHDGQHTGPWGKDSSHGPKPFEFGGSRARILSRTPLSHAQGHQLHKSRIGCRQRAGKLSRGLTDKLFACAVPKPGRTKITRHVRSWRRILLGRVSEGRTTNQNLIRIHADASQNKRTARTLSRALQQIWVFMFFDPGSGGPGGPGRPPRAIPRGLGGFRGPPRKTRDPPRTKQQNL